MIDQLRVQDNFELMQNRGAGFAGPDSEMIDGRGYRDDGSRLVVSMHRLLSSTTCFCDNNGLSMLRGGVTIYPLQIAVLS